jgi:hypothetical protein
MEYNTQNDGVFGPFPSARILENRKQRFTNWICFHPQVGGGEAPAQLGR